MESRAIASISQYSGLTPFIFVVYGGHRGDTVQPGNQNVLSALVWTGQSQEGGARRLHAETADHAQASDVLADRTASARLTVKTVADPKTFWNRRCGGGEGRGSR